VNPQVFQLQIFQLQILKVRLFAMRARNAAVLP